MDLNSSTDPPVKVSMLPAECGWPNRVQFGDHEVSMEDFLVAAYYFLTNTDLAEDDPRLSFVSRVRSLGIVRGWNGSGRHRLAPCPWWRRALR